MIEGRRILAVTAARGGSKGLPRKNLADIGGKPMIAWSIEAGNGSRYVDRAVFSSEDEELMAAAKAWGADVPFRRPAHLSTDEAGIIDVLFHAIDMLGEPYDIVVLLQAASPLRLASDIDAALELCVRRRAPSCVGVTIASKPPFWTYLVDEKNRMVPLLPEYAKATRRQDLPDAYVLNGAVFLAEIPWLRQRGVFTSPDTVAYPMPQERSIDIDGAQDLIVARALMESRLAAQ